MKKILLSVLMIGCFAFNAYALSEAYKNNIYNPGELKPRDSVLKVKAGDVAPDFTLKAVSGKMISLKDYKGKKNVVISFVPAAWTPVCSDQWPGYNIVQDIFENHDSIMLGITVDSIPTLFSWTNQMGNSGLRFYPISGRMALLRKNSVCCGLTVFPKERFLSSIKKESFATLMCMILIIARRWRPWSKSWKS